MGHKVKYSLRIMADIGLSQVATFPDVFEVCGRRFVILKGVFNPIFYDSTEFFARHLPYPHGKVFFEVGIGSGAIALTSVLEGCSSCIGIDINPKAVYNAILNAKLLGVEKQSTFIVKNIEALRNFGGSNVIFWAHPWVNLPATGNHGILERSIIDPGYVGLGKYIKLARYQSNSRVFLGFGNTGDYEMLDGLCRKYQLKIIVRASGVAKMDARYTYQLFELSHASCQRNKFKM